MLEGPENYVPSLTVTPVLAQLLGIPERCSVSDLWDEPSDRIDDEVTADVDRDG